MSPSIPELIVNITELRRHVGERRSVDCRVDLGEIGLDATSVHVEGPVTVAIDLESVSGGIASAGRLAAAWSGACRRCLDPVSGEIEETVDEVFEPAPDEGVTYPIIEDRIDLEPVVRENVLLGLPIAPLCRADCPGPDPEHFPVQLPADEADAAPVDPRWAALDALVADIE